MGPMFSKKVETPIIGYKIGHVHDYENNEMKLVHVSDTIAGASDRIIVGRYRSQFYAFGQTCPSGCGDAPLIEGAFRHGTVRCPWHGACFSAKTGDIEDFPGLEKLPTFKVHRHDAGHLSVDIDPNQLETTRIMPHMCRISSKVNISSLESNFRLVPALQTFVIIGGGAAGFTCAVTLRQNNFQGRIIMITSDWFYPYDRTQVTKNMNKTWNDIKLQDAEFYTDHDIEVLRGTTVEKVDFRNKRLRTLEDRKIIQYHSLLIATGMTPKIYDIDGIHFKNVFTAYSLKDCQRIRKVAENKAVIIAGTSFIAVELACSLSKFASKVTLVCRARWPYGIILGETVGTSILSFVMKKSKNLFFEMSDDVKSIMGNKKGEVRRVYTLKGRSIACDVFILACGGVPNTYFLKDSELKTLPTDRTIPVSKRMQTTIEGVYAAGDVVTFPSAVSVTGFATLGHWPVACKHGQVAALNMLGIKTTVQKTIPFYWTTLFGLTLRYCGNGQHYNDVLVFGDPHEMEFCALYKRDGVILAMLTANCDPIAAELAYDLEHHISYKINEFPPYITDFFSDPPIAADSYVWWRYKDERNVATFDASKIRSLPVDEEESSSSVSTDLEIDKENLQDDSKPHEKIVHFF